MYSIIRKYDAKIFVQYSARINKIGKYISHVTECHSLNIEYLICIHYEDFCYLREVNKFLCVDYV